MKTFVKNRFPGVAQMLGISVPKLIKILRDKKILLNTNGRNLPTQVYIKRGWFWMDYVTVEKESFKAVVPTVDITDVGINEIRKIVNEALFEEIPFIHLYNQIGLEVSNFLLSRKLSPNTFVARVETHNAINIILQKAKGFELILKYDKTEDKLWQLK